MQNSFFPDSDAPLTPFNAGPKKGKSLSIPMYSTIQGLYQKNARMWQVIALVSLLSFFISLFICFYAVRLPKTVPVIVTVDTQGQATYVGRVSQSYWGKDKIPENAKTYQIKKLFANMYTRVTDASAQNSYIRECEKICQGDAVSLLDKFFMENNPFDLFGVKTQTIDMEEPLRQTERTYVIYYNVQKYMNGQPAGGSRHSALVTLDFYNGVPEDNPLGIYITGFDIKEVRE